MLKDNKFSVMCTSKVDFISNILARSPDKR